MHARFSVGFVSLLCALWCTVQFRVFDALVRPEIWRQKKGCVFFHGCDFSLFLMVLRMKKSKQMLRCVLYTEASCFKDLHGKPVNCVLEFCVDSL